MCSTLLCFIIANSITIFTLPNVAESRQCLPFGANHYASMLFNATSKKLVETSLDGTVVTDASKGILLKGDGISLTTAPNHISINGLSRTTCIHNPESCPNGFTFNIIIFVNTGAVNQTVYVSNGGQSDASYGMAIYYNTSGILVAVVTSTTHKWETSVSLTTDVYAVTVVWDGSTITLYAIKKSDDSLTKSSSGSVIRGSVVSSTVDNGYYISKSTPDDVYGQTAYDELLFWEAKQTEAFLSSVYDAEKNELCAVSCTGKAADKFLSCYGCNLFWDCSTKVLYTCMHGYVFDQTTKQCTSSTSNCPSAVTLRVNNTLDCFPLPCVSGPCQNNGTCNNLEFGWQCDCNTTAAGWTGNQCETNIDECAVSLNNCVWNNTNSCIDGIGGLNNYTCQCKTGYNLTDCSNYDNCLSTPCKNGGSCTDDVPADNYTCACVPGYVGFDCETNFDECSSNPCQNGGTCNDEVNQYNCTCPPGYSGVHCEQYDECYADPCVNGTCMDSNQTLADSYVCTCINGFSGRNCSIENECITQNVTCLNGATCQDLVGAWQCNCVPGYDGTYCGNNINECSPDPCNHGGNCTDLINDYNCTCVPGYVDKNCSTNFDECASSPCKNSGNCTDLVNKFSCNCATGYSGATCQLYDECSASPCQNSATCNDPSFNVTGDYTCNCATGFYARNCEHQNGCIKNSIVCQNGGTCDNTTVSGDYNCQCVAGYNGSLCGNNINECALNPCQNGGTCNDQVNQYNCTCPQDYYGTHCENFDECFAKPCKNGANCTEKVGDYTCACAGHYTGKNCTECATGFSNPGCSIENECITKSVVCQNGGVCVDQVGNFSCNCTAGYNGQFCQTNIDDCASQPCGIGGQCVDGVNKFTCNCHSTFQNTLCDACITGYKGTYCNITDECILNNNPCENGGNCTDLTNDYSCSCVNGFSGKNCTVENKCTTQGVVCQNGGTCTTATGICTCTTNWVGDRCQNDNPCYPNPCQYNGACQLLSGIGTYSCNCPTGYSGNNCEVTPCTNVNCQNNGTCTVSNGQYQCVCKSGYNGDLCQNQVTTNAGAQTSTAVSGWRTSGIILIVFILLIVIVVAVVVGIFVYKYQNRHNKVAPVADDENPSIQETKPADEGQDPAAGGEGNTEEAVDPTVATGGAMSNSDPPEADDGGDEWADKEVELQHAPEEEQGAVAGSSTGRYDVSGKNEKKGPLEGPIIDAMSPPPKYEGPTPVSQ